MPLSDDITDNDICNSINFRSHEHASFLVMVDECSDLITSSTKIFSHHGITNTSLQRDHSAEIKELSKGFD